MSTTAETLGTDAAGIARPEASVATSSPYWTSPSRAPISRAKRLMWTTISSLMLAS